MEKRKIKYKDIFSIKNIYSFIEGNTKHYMEKFNMLSSHIKEQVEYRLEKCKEDCVKTNKCIHCGCPTLKRVFVKRSCNNGERFPNLMSKEDWEEFKKAIEDEET